MPSLNNLRGAVSYDKDERKRLLMASTISSLSLPKLVYFVIFCVVLLQNASIMLELHLCLNLFRHNYHTPIPSQTSQIFYPFLIYSRIITLYFYFIHSNLKMQMVTVNYIRIITKSVHVIYRKLIMS